LPFCCTPGQLKSLHLISSTGFIIGFFAIWLVATVRLVEQWRAEEEEADGTTVAVRR
jgi:hypothetical protein